MHCRLIPVEPPSLCRPLEDVWLMKHELDQIAKENEAAGNTVDRGIFGTVILKLSDGEAHFTPGGDGVYLYLFRNRDAAPPSAGVPSADPVAGCNERPTLQEMEAKGVSYIAMRDLGMDEHSIDELMKEIDRMFAFQRICPNLDPAGCAEHVIREKFPIMPVRHKERLVSKIRQAAEQHAGMAAKDIFEKSLDLRINRPNLRRF